MSNAFTAEELRAYESLCFGFDRATLMSPRSMKSYLFATEIAPEMEHRLGRRLGKFEYHYRHAKWMREPVELLKIDPIPFPEET